MYVNHYERRMRSQSPIQREDSPTIDDIPMSPNTRRRTEFTMKQLQNGVITRARSTLHSLGDVWKPKTNGKPNESATPKPHTSPLNQRTLDFFMAWSRHKKSPDSTKSDFDALDLMQSNSNNRKQTVTGKNNNRFVNYSNFFNGVSAKQMFGNRAKPNIPISPVNRAKINNSKNKLVSSAAGVGDGDAIVMENNHSPFDNSHSKKTNKLSTAPPKQRINSSGGSVRGEKSINRLALMAKNKSFEIDDLLARDGEMYAKRGHSLTMNNTIRRSFDENINYLNCDGHDGDNDDDDECDVYDGDVYDNGKCIDADAYGTGEYASKKQRRRTWNISLNETLLEGDDYYGSQIKNTDAEMRKNVPKESVIKARLRLQKISVNDDIVLNKTAAKRPGILFRHNSVDPKASERCSSPSICSNNDSDSSDIKKERKKITFREPIISEKCEIRSDALERAKRFLDQYEKNGSGIRRPSEHTNRLKTLDKSKSTETPEIREKREYPQNTSAADDDEKVYLVIEPQLTLNALISNFVFPHQFGAGHFTNLI